MRTNVLGTPIDWLKPEELERKLQLFVGAQKPHQLTTVNPEFIVTAQHNTEFAQALLQSDVSLPDGTGIVIARAFYEANPPHNRIGRFFAFLTLTLQYLIIPHSFPYKRTTGVELSETVMRLAEKHGWRVFLLGAAKGVAEKAGHVWQARYPGLTIAGTSSANPDNSHIVTQIKHANADVLLVAYGAPKQDIFIAKHKNELQVPIMVGVGGTFDYTAGVMQRPPRWMQRTGLEWLGRLIQQPKRFKRMLRALLVFPWYIIRDTHNS